MRSLDIHYLSTKSLKPYERNARTHSKKQIRQIADSIETFGFTNPLLIDDDTSILAGHGRLEAAKLLDMTPEQKRAYILANLSRISSTSR